MAKQTINYGDHYYYGDVNSAGQPHGFGKETYADGGYFEGEYVNGQRTGKGVCDWGDGTVQEGNWVNGTLIKGKITWPSGSWYEGDWVNGNRTGKGVYRWLGTFTYEGDFLNNDLHGHARVVYDDGRIYEGEYKNDTQNGKGKMTYADGSSYEGEFRNGEQHGKGKITWPSGSWYEGDWVNGNRTGKGVYRWLGTFTYEGDFLNNDLHGHARVVYDDGSWYEGEYKNDKQMGKCKIYFGEGDWAGSTFEGEVIDGFWNEANGRITLPSKEFYEGSFVSGKLHGYGKYSSEFFIHNDPDNPRYDIYEGEWINGEISKGKKISYSNDGAYIQEGHFEGRSLCGQGKITTPNGTIYEGEFSKLFGFSKGTILYPDGSSYVGNSGLTAWTGEGTYTDKLGRKFYCEKWSDMYETESDITVVLTKTDGTKAYGKITAFKFVSSGLEISLCETRTLTLSDGSTYMGLTNAMAEPHGTGRRSYPDGSVYSGDFRFGMCNGNGFLKYPNGDYENGSWHNNWFTGKALLHVEDGNIFKGNIDDDSFIYGTYTYANGDVYEGEFDGGVPCSITDENSTMTYANGATYTGHFWNGDWSGEGTYVDENGVSYYCEEWDGFFKASEDYDVTMTTPDGDEVVGKIVDGEFVADDESWGDEEIEEEPEVKEDAYEGERNSYGQPHGVGKMRYANGETYEGEWKNGAWYGAGVYTLSDGTTFFGSFIGTRSSESVVKNGCVRGRLTNGIFFAK